MHRLRSLSMALLFAGIGVCCARPPAAAAADLVVTAYGGVWEQSFRACIVEPFERQYGKSVDIVLGVAYQWLNQIQASSGRPPIDIVMMSSDGAFDGIRRGLIDRATPERVPNLNQIPQRFRDFAGDMGAVHSYGAMGIACNSETVKTPPRSWQEFIDGTIAGKWRASIPGLNYGPSSMMSTIWMLSNVSGGGIDNVDPRR